MGDSITAAALSKGGPLEYRQVSWSSGVGNENAYTMPYLLQQYVKEPLVGPSKGKFQVDQLGPCCGKDPWWSGIAADDDQLNAALSGGVSGDWKLEVQHLTDLVKGKGFGIAGLGGFPKWSLDQQEHYKNSWKVLTIFLGLNDVLTTLDACSDDASKRNAIVTKFRENMVALFDHLVADEDGVFSKLYVNVGTLFSTSYLGLRNSEQGWCEITGGSFLQSEFPCMRNGGDILAKGKLVDAVTAKMNDVLVDLAAEYDLKRPDFGINLVQTQANQQITHRDLRSGLDCFHPTAKAHRILGTALWNAMLEPSLPQPLDTLDNIPACVDATTRLVTYSQARAWRKVPATLV